MTGHPRTIPVSRDGAELRELATRLVPPDGTRRMVGLAGEPGSGKSRVAGAVASHLGERAAVVPLDGYHLADVELVRQGLLDRKGAPETFDAWGYAALLGRLRSRPDHHVYAPAFERDLEQPLAGAVAVPPEVDIVLTEGNYLLLERDGWPAARASLDEVWFVDVEPSVRLQRLEARHVAFGKPAPAASEWVARVDEPNARLVRAAAHRADLRLDLTEWGGSL